MLAKELQSIVSRELHFILTDARLRSVVLLAPFIYAVLMCAVYWQESVDEVPIAVVQHDVSQPARTFVRYLDASPKLRVQSMPDSLEEAQGQLKSGMVFGIVVIDSEFTKSIKKGKSARLVCMIDASHLVIANTIASAISSISQTLSVGISTDKLMRQGTSQRQALAQSLPIRIDLRPLHNPEFSYSRFMIPGLLMTVLQQVILLGLALSWSGERESGSLIQLFRLSSSPIILLVGKILPYLLIYGLIQILFLLLFFPLSGIPMEASWLLFTFSTLFLISVVTWGAWISAWLPSRLFATQVLMFLAMPSFLLSGYTWPSHAMPASLQVIAKFLPLTHYIDGLRRLSLGAADFSSLAASCVILLAFTLVHTLLAYGGIKRLQKQITAEHQA